MSHDFQHSKERAYIYFAHVYFLRHSKNVMIAENFIVAKTTGEQMTPDLSERTVYLI